VSITSILHVGASGLRAATLGVNVASQNATNAATPGYSRRTLLQDPLPGPPSGGNGVATHGPLRTIDRFVERRLLGATAAHSEAEARLAALGPVDDAFAADAGLGTALDAFQTAIDALTANPSDGPTRAAVLSSASSLAEAFQRTSQSLAQAQRDADGQIGDQVSQVNQLVSQIDTIQTQMKKAEISGEEASDLRDQRDQRIRELAKLVPVTTVPGPQGAVSVLLDGGVSLVAAEGGSTPLGTQVDATTGMTRITRISAGAAEDVTSRIASGSIGGLVAARDQKIPAAQTRLDQLAFDVAGAYNAVHTAGYGTDGGTGRALFSTTATATDAAANFAVSSDVDGHPERVAAATDPTLTTGDNRNALALQQLANASIASSGTESATQALAGLVASAGQSVQDAQRDADVLGAAESQASALRASVSGVNTDDEMVALTQFQRAYDASLKVVQAADQMFQDLIAMKR
jgi:flagellar hook-associated protein 1 FlgK